MNVDRLWACGKPTTIILLKENSNKIILRNIILYQYIPCEGNSYLVTETSYFSRQELTQIPTTGQSAESKRDFKTLSLQ